MEDNIESSGARKIQEPPPSEFSFEACLWKGSFKVTTKSMTPEIAGEMLKQVIGVRSALFWFILSLITLMVILITLRPEIISIQWSG